MENVSGFKWVVLGGIYMVQNYLIVIGDLMVLVRIIIFKLINLDGNVFNLSWNVVGDDFNVGIGGFYILLNNQISF